MGLLIDRMVGLSASTSNCNFGDLKRLSASRSKSKEKDLGFFGGTKGEDPKGGAN